jgi:hypothetical protein
MLEGGSKGGTPPTALFAYEHRPMSRLHPSMPPLSLKLRQAKLLSDVVCVQQAGLAAKRLQPLTEDEQKDVDEFPAKELEAKDAWQ